MTWASSSNVDKANNSNNGGIVTFSPKWKWQHAPRYVKESLRNWQENG